MQNEECFMLRCSVFIIHSALFISWRITHHPATGFTIGATPLTACRAPIHNRNGQLLVGTVPGGRKTSLRGKNCFLKRSPPPSAPPKLYCEAPSLYKSRMARQCSSTEG